MDLKKLGQTIRTTRRLQDKTVDDLAVAAGVHPNTIYALERGGGGRLVLLDTVAKALGTTVDKIIRESA